MSNINLLKVIILPVYLQNMFWFFYLLTTFQNLFQASNGISNERKKTSPNQNISDSTLLPLEFILINIKSLGITLGVEVILRLLEPRRPRDELVLDYQCYAIQQKKNICSRWKFGGGVGICQICLSVVGVACKGIIQTDCFSCERIQLVRLLNVSIFSTTTLKSEFNEKYVRFGVRVILLCSLMPCTFL